MDRRKSLKIIGVGSLATSIFYEACKLSDKKKVETPSPAPVSTDNAAGPARYGTEEERYKSLIAQTFFTAHEMATITLLVDIIIPKDDVSGSATDAGVPDFIEFIVKDMPENQIPLRGGLRWFDMQSFRRFQQPFTDCDQSQRMQLVDDIAWPKKAKPEMSQGVSFFSLLRDLTCTGFYTTKIGIADIGYAGNQPNQWNGVPDDVLKQYGIAYTEKELKECVSYT